MDKSALINSCAPVFLGSRHTEGTKKLVGKSCRQKPKCFPLCSIYIQISKANVHVPHNTKADNLLLKSLTGQILWPTNVFYGQKFYLLKLISLICEDFLYVNYVVASDLADIVNKWHHLHLLVNQEGNFPPRYYMNFYCLSVWMCVLQEVMPEHLKSVQCIVLVNVIYGLKTKQSTCF